MNSNDSFDDSGLIISVLEPVSNDLHNRTYRWPALFLSFFSLFGICGNLFVCLAIITERRLQNRTNWFLFSLALADMIVSGVVIPFAIIKEFLGYWILGTILCDLWLFLDVCSCTSSIMHIVVISIDRYLAIKNPLTLRSRQDKRQICPLIVLIWLIAIFLSSPMIILGVHNPYNILINNQCLINNQIFVIYGSVVSFVIPLIIVIVTYGLTVHRLKTQIKQSQSQYAHEQIQVLPKPSLRRQSASSNNLTTKSSASNLAVEVNLRRKRLRRQQTSIDLSEETFDKIYYDSEQKKLSFEHHYQPQKFFAHTEYTCPENSFCQIKYTCEKHENHPLNIDCQHCAKESSKSIIQIRPNPRRKPRPISLPVSVYSHLSSTINRNSIKRPWRRITWTPSLGTTRAKSSAVRNEQKAVKVLGVVFAIFVIAWFPFCILNILQGVCKTCSINSNILDGFVWLGYVSSSINPVVYTIFNRNFRLKFITLFKCQCLYKTNRKRQLSYYQSHSNLHGSRIHQTNGLVQNDIRRFNAHRVVNEPIDV